MFGGVLGVEAAEEIAVLSVRDGLGQGSSKTYSALSKGSASAILNVEGRSEMKDGA